MIIRGSKAQSRSAERKKQLRPSRELYQAVSAVYLILFREKTSGARELWTQIIELILLTMSINWLNTFKKIFTELAFYIFTFVLYSFLKIFLPFFSFNLKAIYKEELFQKILTSITMLHCRSVGPHEHTQNTTAR